MKVQDFTTWLLSQQGTGYPVGHLADDVARDEDWPKTARQKATFRNYLERAGACRAALECFEAAWKRFRDSNAGGPSRAN